jgi:hypothetical protein
VVDFSLIIQLPARLIHSFRPYVSSLMFFTYSRCLPGKDVIPGNKDYNMEISNILLDEVIEPSIYSSSLSHVNGIQLLSTMGRQGQNYTSQIFERQEKTRGSYPFQVINKLSHPEFSGGLLPTYSLKSHCDKSTIQEFESNTSNFEAIFWCNDNKQNSFSESQKSSFPPCDINDLGINASRFSYLFNQSAQSDDWESKQVAARGIKIDIKPENFRLLHNSLSVPISESLDTVRFESTQELYGRHSSQKNEMNDTKNLLYSKGNDEKHLSAYQCLIRKYIQYFEASEEDVTSTMQGRNKPIVSKQVGIRCCFCARRAPQHRTRGSTYYPTTLQGLYQASQNLASVHLSQNCPLIPESMMRKVLELRAKKSSIGGGKTYWAESARSKGIFESSHGRLLINRDKDES